jgi:hypothetical protein
VFGLLTRLIQFLTSRVSTPVPFRPKHLRNFSEAELEALEKLSTVTNGNATPTSSTSTEKHQHEFSPSTPSKLGQGSEGKGKVDLELLEKKAEAEGGDIN